MVDSFFPFFRKNGVWSFILLVLILFVSKISAKYETSKPTSSTYYPTLIPTPSPNKDKQTLATSLPTSGQTSSTYYPTKKIHTATTYQPNNYTKLSPMTIESPVRAPPMRNPAPTLGAASDKLASMPSTQNLFQRVLVIVLENMDYKKAIRNPYFQFIMEKGAVFTNFHGIGHPSYPNYVAMVAGDHFDIASDHQESLNETSIADLLEAKGLSWKNYAEDYPGGCFLGKKSGLYARKHVPFLSFLSIQEDSKRCARVVPSDQFMVDWKSRQLPTYSLFSPNLINDGHNTNLSTGAKLFVEFFFRFSSAIINLSHFPYRFNSSPRYFSLAMDPRISRSDCVRSHRYEWNSHRDNI